MEVERCSLRLRGCSLRLKEMEVEVERCVV